MANVMKHVLDRLLGLRKTGQLVNVSDALAMELDRVKDFFDRVGPESSPATADDQAIDSWLTLLGLQPLPNETVASKQSRAQAAYYTLGSQAIGYLQQQISLQFPKAILVERPDKGPFIYNVEGSFGAEGSFAYLVALLQRIAPAHLTPEFNIRPSETPDVARCYVGIVGSARCSADVSAQPEQSDKAIANLGIVGLARVGRQ